jgi:hypothetical protein
MYRKANIPLRVIDARYDGKKALTNRSDTPPFGVLLCAHYSTVDHHFDHGDSADLHTKTHRTCQLIRRIDTVDVGDVMNSVLWGERGDVDDKDCNGRSLWICLLMFARLDSFVSSERYCHAKAVT